MVIFLLAILLATIVLAYYACSLVIVLVMANLPRQPVNEKPDWGTVKDCFVPAINGKKIECWVIHPEREEYELEKKPAILLVQGWGRSQ